MLHELGDGGVERDGDLLARPVAGLLDRAQDDLDGGLVGRQRRREAALVALAGGVALVVQDRAQRGEDLRAGPERLGERGEPDGHDHELLEVRGVLGVLAAVEDVEHRDRQDPGADAAEPAVERDLVGRGGRVRAGERDAEDRVRAQLALVGRAVELDQRVVDVGLVRGVEAEDRWPDPLGHVRDRRQDALAAVAGPCPRRGAPRPRGPRSRRRTGRRRGPASRPP